MGESVAEATLISWLKEVGDKIDTDESIVEIATDKVDSDVPSEFPGILIEKRFDVNDTIKVGEIIAVIDSVEIKDDKVENISENNTEDSIEIESKSIKESSIINETSNLIGKAESLINLDSKEEKRFYSPLVKSIAKKENLSNTELETISGTGKDKRVTKKDS